MDQIKEHWPKIAVGVAALALSFYVYRSMSKEKLEGDNGTILLTGKDGKAWPIPRKIISEDDTTDAQREKLFKWLDGSLAKYLDTHGSFKFDENNNLNEEDFLRIYDLIESIGRFELKTLRENNETSRKKLFEEAFKADDSNEQAFKKYIDKIFSDIEKEITLYQEVQDLILKKVKIHETIWNSSMEIYLPSGEPYIRKAIRFSMSSPFQYKGNKSETDITEIYKTASDFGLKLLIDSKTFNKVLMDQGELDDEQDKLIILDYLVIDYVQCQYNLSSNSFKSAISAYGLLESDELLKQIEKIVQTFVSPKK